MSTSEGASNKAEGREIQWRIIAVSLIQSVFPAAYNCYKLPLMQNKIYLGCIHQTK